MASTSGSPSTSEKNGLLIEQFCSVTGAGRDKAYKMLEVCNWNLEMAINMHVDSDVSANENNESNKPVNIEDDVRPPIPQSRGILVEEDLTFQYGLRSRKRRPHSVFDGFRDFQAEARLQELSAEDSESLKKRRTLEDLFRPPLDLMYRGNFDSARDFGQTSNRWLMVNIQNSQEFACQVLNRDVWSNQSVKNLINKHFVFWQVYSDSIDGERYMQFYNPIEFPYIAVIDPRTGEKLVVWHDVDATTLFELVDAFLKEFNSPNGASTDVDSSPVKCSSLLDQSEDDQIKAALAASLKESNLTRSSIDDNESDFETFESDSECTGDKLTKNSTEHNSETSCDTIDVVGCSESNDKGDSSTEATWKDYLGADDDPKTELVLRFPDGNREQISWPCSTKIKALVLYLEELGYDSGKYELVTNYPRRNLCQLELSNTLKEVDLFPREVIIVQQKS